MVPTKEHSEGGVYRITCLIDGRIYIGMTNSFKRRRVAHFSNLKSGRHPNRSLQKAFNLHGEVNFEFTPVLCCSSSHCKEFETLLIHEHQALNRSNVFNYRRDPNQQPERPEWSSVRIKIDEDAVEMLDKFRRTAAGNVSRRAAATKIVYDALGLTK